MPSTLKIRVVQARDLPVMDKQNMSTDAYVIQELFCLQLRIMISRLLSKIMLFLQ